MNFNSIARERSVIFSAFLLAIAVLSLSGAGQVALADNKEVRRIVVFGDSLVAGYGLAPGKGFPEQLAAILKADHKNLEIINAGVSGDTSSGGLARLDWSVPESIDAVILELGANDALRGVSPTLIRKNIETMITRLQQRNIVVLLAGMKAPPNMGRSYEEAFNSIYPDLAEKYELIFYPFFLDGVIADPKFNQADAMHPTAEGIGVIVDRFMPTMELLLSRLDGK